MLPEFLPGSKPDSALHFPGTMLSTVGEIFLAQAIGYKTGVYLHTIARRMTC